MKHPASLFMPLQGTHSIQELRNYLAEKYVLTELPSRRRSIAFLDSFDWRLYRRERVCFVEDGSLHLVDFADAPTAPALPLEEEEEPRLWRSMPESEVRSELAAALEARVLLKQAELCGTTSELHVESKDGEAAFLVLLNEFAAGKGGVCTAELRAVHGSLKQFLRLADRLKKFGDPRPGCRRHALEAVLAEEGRTPLASSFFVDLKPDMGLRTAAKLIFRQLLFVMQSNEQGAIEDVDIEFLHDFRQAVRRTRSALTLLKDGMEPEISRRFGREFRELGAATGPVRDLDVQLTMKERCQAQLPEVLHDGLQLLFDELAQRRAEAQREMVRRLTEPGCRAAVKAWQEWLETEDHADSDERTIGATARKIIRKQLDRLLRDSQSVDGQSSDRELHRVRIQAKKLRCSLEFFRSLHPEKEMDKLIGHVKLLLDHLGMQNDLAVQEEMLRQHLAAIEPGSDASEQMAAAVGGLLASIHLGRKQLRTELGPIFDSFASGSNMKRYGRLFRKG